MLSPGMRIRLPSSPLWVRKTDCSPAAPRQAIFRLGMPSGITVTSCTAAFSMPLQDQCTALSLKEPL